MLQMILKRSSFKLMNNSVYGKTMENQRKRIKTEVVTTEKHAAKILSKPNVETFHILDDNLSVL